MEKTNKTKKQLLDEIELLKQQLDAIRNAKNHDCQLGLSESEQEYSFLQKYTLEKNLQNQEIQYASLFERTNDAVFFIDMDGYQINVNQQAADMLGYERDEAIGLHISQVIVPEQQEQSYETKSRLLAGESIPVYQRKAMKKDGTVITVEINAALIRDLKGDPLFIQSIARDISQRVRAEETLRESEIYFRTLFEYAGDAIFIEDENDRIVEANLQACRLLGYTKEELLQLTVADLQAPEHRGISGTIVVEELEKHGDKLFEKVDIRKDGTRVPVEVTTVKFKKRFSRTGHVDCAGCFRKKKG